MFASLRGASRYTAHAKPAASIASRTRRGTHTRTAHERYPRAARFSGVRDIAEMSDEFAQYPGGYATYSFRTYPARCDTEVCYADDIRDGCNARASATTARAARLLTYVINGARTYVCA